MSTKTVLLIIFALLVGVLGTLLYVNKMQPQLVVPLPTVKPTINNEEVLEGLGVSYDKSKFTVEKTTLSSEEVAVPVVFFRLAGSEEVVLKIVNLSVFNGDTTMLDKVLPYFKDKKQSGLRSVTVEGKQFNFVPLNSEGDCPNQEQNYIVLDSRYGVIVSGGCKNAVTKESMEEILKIIESIDII